jgi:ABC-type phosphate transport system substrate-binding protein
MRVAIVCSLLMLVACGGGAKPARTESSDTASLDPKGSESGGGSTSIA